MKNQFKTIAAVLALGMVGYAAYAETITVSTFYPSPYGSYSTLEIVTLQGVGGAANVWVQPGAGNVGIGFATPTAPASKLDVRGGHIRAADVAGGTTAFLQGTGAAGAGSVFMGSLHAGPVNIGNTEGNASLVLDGGNTTVNGLLLGAAASNGPVRMQDATGQTGLLQLDCDTPTNACYVIAVYA